MVHRSKINRQTLVAREWSRKYNSRPYYLCWAAIMALQSTRPVVVHSSFVALIPHHVDRLPIIKFLFAGVFLIFSLQSFKLLLSLRTFSFSWYMYPINCDCRDLMFPIFFQWRILLSSRTKAQILNGQWATCLVEKSNPFLIYFKLIT